MFSAWLSLLWSSPRLLLLADSTRASIGFGKEDDDDNLGPREDNNASVSDFSTVLDCH